MLSHPTYMIDIFDLVAIGVKTSMRNSGCSLDEKFNKLICMNP